MGGTKKADAPPTGPRKSGELKRKHGYGSDSILGVFDIKIVIKKPKCTSSKHLNLSPADFV